MEAEPQDPTRRNVTIAAAVVGVLLIAAAIVVIARRTDEPGVSAGPAVSASSTTPGTPVGSVPATANPTPSATPATSGTLPGSTTRPSTTAGTSETTTSAVLSTAEAATVVWPSPEGALRYDDPEDAARGFAVDLVGFEDPVVGAFQEGDQRSGEVEVRALDQGATTTVIVRRLGDGHWWVLGAATPDIELDDPVPGTAIDDPLVLSGRARAFEGTVNVAVYSRSSSAPLGTGFVTGNGGIELGPFSDQVAWSNPGGGWGVVVLYTVSAADGRVWQAMAIPVGFIGGD